MKKFIVAIISVLCLILVSSCEKTFISETTDQPKDQHEMPGVFEAVLGDWVPTYVKVTADGETYRGNLADIAKEKDAELDCVASFGKNELTLKMDLRYPNEPKYNDSGVINVKFKPSNDGKTVKVEFYIVSTDDEINSAGEITLKKK